MFTNSIAIESSSKLAFPVDGVDVTSETAITKKDFTVISDVQLHIDSKLDNPHIQITPAIEITVPQQQQQKMVRL